MKRGNVPNNDVLTPPTGTPAAIAPEVHPPPQAAPPSTAPRDRARRHKLVVYGGRLAVLVVVVGGWELCTRLKVVDPFFYGQPSKVVSQIHTWISHGTSQGSLWQQINVTLKE